MHVTAKEAKKGFETRHGEEKYGLSCNLSVDRYFQEYGISAWIGHNRMQTQDWIQAIFMMQWKQKERKGAEVGNGTAYKEKIRKARSLKRTQPDASAPQDNFSEDPPEGWELPSDEAMQEELNTAEARFQQDNMLKSPLPNTSESPHKQVHIEEVPDEEDLIWQPFPWPVGSTYGKEQT
ncbi:hypothetical protein M422DRAFT_243895 [Sphaerobolus stellatus SS14]|nr:hypothetical protein M422DRAFT_243895 [Sphaerobolus stellatus SS14]